MTITTTPSVLSNTLMPGTVIAPSASAAAFDGAGTSTRRGYIYAPKNTRTELTSYTRETMLTRARWLTRNVGLAKRCAWGLARMAGWMSPVALTKDKEWNKLATDLFERRYGNSAIAFDAQGRQNFYSYQPLITATRLQDGDFLTVFTQSANGLAQVMSYEGHQIGNSLASTDTNIRDGVWLNKFDRALGYNVLDDMRKGTLIPANKAVLHADFMSVGHVRGVTGFHHAINNLIDLTEIKADLKTGIKIANRQGHYIINTLPQTRSTAPLGMTAATGTPQLQTDTQWSIQDLYSADKASGKSIELKAGQELKTLLDQRPHPNTMAFHDELVRDIAAGFDLASEVLWNIAALGGASVRYVMADAQKAVERQQQLLVDQFLTRFWLYFVSLEIAAGRLRPCEDPNWYLVGWQPPAKLTVDIGREGRLSIDLHKAGMLTLQSWYGSQGTDWKDSIDQSVEEYAYKMRACMEAEKKYGFPIRPELVWPDTSAAAPAQEFPPLDQVHVEPAHTAAA